MLNIKEVHSGYGKLKILRGINLNVPQGGVVALLGGNGTGKSTLLKTISGLVPVMEGSIEFDGQIISGKKPHEIVRSGLVQVTQSKEAYPAMTVEENLMLGAYTRSDSGGVGADLERVYDFFPVLRQRRKVLSGTLSGGEVQMLVIGRGLMAKPKMLMLDEPSAALAPKVVLEIFSNIYKISQYDSGIVHNICKIDLSPRNHLKCSIWVRPTFPSCFESQTCSYFRKHIILVKYFVDISFT